MICSTQPFQTLLTSEQTPRARRVGEDLGQKRLGSRSAMPGTMDSPRPERTVEAEFRSKANMGIVNVQGTTVTNEGLDSDPGLVGGSPGPYGVRYRPSKRPRGKTSGVSGSLMACRTIR